MATATKQRYETIDASHIGEKLHVAKLRSGFEVIYAPRRGFAGKFAMFATRYGSTDSAWTTPSGKTRRVPDGIAHFLEHQLFKKEDGDTQDRFTANGAYSNAMTSHNVTAYIFECVSNFEQNLALLMKMCLVPYFRDDLVETERGIIEQEIANYLDHPYWMGYQDLLAALYKRHPVRIDIVGTRKSVGRITPKQLTECHQRFYHPRNCALLVSGDVDMYDLVQQTDELVNEFFDGRKVEKLKPLQVDEPKKVARTRVVRPMHTMLPRMLVGYKDTSKMSGKSLVRRETVVGMTLDLLFGRGTKFFDKLYSDGIVSGDFSASYRGELGFGYVIIGGETTNPAELEQRLENRIEEAQAGGFSESDLVRKRNKIRGRYLRNFETPEATIYAHSSSWRAGVNLFDFPTVADSIKMADLKRCLTGLFRKDNRAVSVVRKPA